ncbi:MAG: hypothetical protein ACE5J5_01865 [Candidatus Hydrothermarchaeales archaeon]
MVSITSLEFIGRIVTLPFYIAVLYLFFTRARTRYEPPQQEKIPMKDYF